MFEQNPINTLFVNIIIRRFIMEKCALCNNEVESITHIAEQWLIETIREENPDWISDDGACEKCIDYYKSLDDIVG